MCGLFAVSPSGLENSWGGRGSHCNAKETAKGKEILGGGGHLRRNEKDILRRRDGGREGGEEGSIGLLSGP